MMRQFKSRQFAFFLVTGGIAAAVNFASRIVFNWWTSFSLAIILAYVAGMATAFILARLFVFKDSRKSLQRSGMLFVLVNLVAVLQTWLISMALAYYVLPAIGVQAFVHEIAHATGLIVPVFTSYIGHKKFSFS